MMKYLKAEAEVIKFDNSDVVTGSTITEEEAYRQCKLRAVAIWAIVCVFSWGGSWQGFMDKWEQDMGDSNNSGDGAATASDTGDWL